MKGVDHISDCLSLCQIEGALLGLRADATAAEAAIRDGDEGEDVDETGAGPSGRTGARSQEHTEEPRQDRTTVQRARYSFIHPSELGRQWRERKCPIFETVARGGFEAGLT